MFYALTLLAACGPVPAEAPMPVGLPPVVVGGFNRENLTKSAAESRPQKTWLVYPKAPAVGQGVKVQVVLHPELQEPVEPGDEQYSWGIMDGDIVQVHDGGTRIVADVMGGVERPSDLDGFWLVTLEARDEHAEEGPWIMTGMERRYPFGKATEEFVDFITPAVVWVIQWTPLYREGSEG